MEVDKKLKKILNEFGRIGDKERLSSQLNAVELNLKKEKEYQDLLKELSKDKNFHDYLKVKKLKELL